MAAATMPSDALGSVLTAIGLAEIAAHEKRQLRRFAVQLALMGGEGSAELESGPASMDFAAEFKVRAECIEGRPFDGNAGDGHE